MSSNSVNKGNQILSHVYREEARAKYFNRLLSQLLPYGIYSGAALSRTNNIQISIAPSVSLVKSNEEVDLNIAVRVETQSSQSISLESGNTNYCDISKPYIVFRFGWSDSETNYMDMLAVSYSNDPSETDETKILPYDLIVGKVLFEDTGSGNYIIKESNPFDYTRKSNAFIPDSILAFRELRVQASENNPKKIYVTSGSINTSQGRQEVTGGDYPTSITISDTTTMGRIDLVYVDENGEIQILEGTPAVTPVTPTYGIKKVIGEISRGTNRSDILGTDIRQVNVTRQGMITAADYPITDAGDYYADKNIEDALQEIYEFANGLLVADAIDDTMIDWGTGANQVSAIDIPIADSNNRYTGNEVETALQEIAGSGRTTETVKDNADDLDTHEAIVATSQEIHGVREYVRQQSIHEYQSDVSYSTNDAVVYNGALYFSLTDSNHGNTPDSSPANWSEFSGGTGQTLFDEVITNQAEFNASITRTGANAYKFNDSIKSIYFRDGSFLMYGGTSYLSDGDTWGYIDTNYCTTIYFDTHAALEVGDTVGYIKVSRDETLLFDVYIQGDGLSAAAIEQSFLLDAEKCTFLHCKTSNRESNTTFYPFRHSSTTSDNKTSQFIGCRVWDCLSSGTYIPFMVENTNNCWDSGISSSEINYNESKIKEISYAINGDYTISMYEPYRQYNVTTAENEREQIFLPPVANCKGKKISIQKLSSTYSTVIIKPDTGDSASIIYFGKDMHPTYAHPLLFYQNDIIDLESNGSHWVVINNWKPLLDTGWISRSDWAGVKPGALSAVGGSSSNFGEIFIESTTGYRGVYYGVSVGSFLFADDGSGGVGGYFSNGETLTGQTNSDTITGYGNTKDADDYVYHGWGTSIYRINVEFSYSTDGSENNTINIPFDMTFAPAQGGLGKFQVNDGTLLVQTGYDGLTHMQITGSPGDYVLIDTEDAYYKITISPQ